MVGRFDQKQDDPVSSPENSSDSPLSGTDHDIKITNNVSFPKQRKSAKKRVVSVTINDGGEKAADVSIPPSDSWAWRKYGQKPIKGSPYPRGYYKCSSSKGCPARKQVEKSRADPNVLQVTYFYEHNHSRPAARNAMTATPEAVVDSNKSKRQRAESEEIDLCHESQNNEPGWFLNLEPATSYSTIDESPVMSETKVTDVTDVEDESLFADLGELPEFSRGFRRGWDEE